MPPRRRSRRGSRRALPRRPVSPSSRPRRSSALTRSMRTSPGPTRTGPKPTPPRRSTSGTGPSRTPGWRSSTRSTPASTPTRRRQRSSSGQRAAGSGHRPSPAVLALSADQSQLDVIAGEVILMREPRATGAIASDPTQDQLLPDDRQPVADSLAPGSGRLVAALERRAPWIEALIVLATIAAGFIVLGFLAAYFRDYFHLALIFFLAWLLAFLVSPIADFLQQRLRRLPRAAAVVGVIVPVIVIGAVIGVRIVLVVGESFAELVGALPGLIANPPPVLTDIQAWFEARGIATDVTSAYESIVGGILGALAGGGGALFAGAAGAFGTFVDAIVGITL